MKEAILFFIVPAILGGAIGNVLSNRDLNIGRKELESMVEYCDRNKGCGACPYSEMCAEVQANIPAGAMNSPDCWEADDIDFILSMHK